MANERTIPSEEPKSVVTFTILSGGVAVTKAYHVLSIIVDKEVNRIASATIMISDGEAARQSFDISNKADFEPGKEIEIKTGYRNNEDTVFKGIVIRHGIRVRNKTSVLVVECRDKAVKLTVACKSKYFVKMKDSEVMEDIIAAHGLDKSGVSPTSVQHKQLVQYNSTDWDFILCRADANGLLCTTDNGKINVRKPNFAAAPKLTILYGATVHDLDAQIDARYQFKTVKGSTWRHTDQELLGNVEAANPDVPEAGNLSAATLANVINENEFRLYHSGQLDTPELQAWVNAKMLKHRLAKIRGSVTTDGTAAIVPCDMMQLDGVGERFRGKLFVTGVSHRIEKGVWQTVFQFGVDPEWFAQSYNVQQPLAGALLPAVQGLHAGVVTQLKDDPDGEDRIKLRIPIIHAAEEGTWCRVACLDAGNNRGMFFRPEIGDEVVVGFMNDDPRHAVVLGMLNSKAKPAPLKATDENHEKGFVSRSGMKVLFNDNTEKITINITTPHGNKISLDEGAKTLHIQDMNGNKIVLNKDGITIESVKDIVMKAASNVKTEGMNINVKGKAQTKVEGAGGAELSSGATTIVKGTTVMLN